ncbi:hypothetical protein MKY41_16005 [Sporosarcina sp. FSL W7-1349]|uniref:hypothetical protein n=1 Tax=Sporosarcina sp. FSL W7-1349 TaxID=2921561 RepID=UPI0030F8D5D3
MTVSYRALTVRTSAVTVELIDMTVWESHDSLIPGPYSSDDCHDSQLICHDSSGET